MTRYRVLLQGECLRPDETWRGFWTVREVNAQSQDTAEVSARTNVMEAWARDLGGITALKIVASWPVGFWGRLFSNRDSGHSFYNDDVDAQLAALDMELAVARAPRHVRHRVRKLMET